MIDDQLGADPQPPLVRRVQKILEIVERPVLWIHIEIIRDVVAIVAQWRRIKRQQPDGGDSEFVKIIELLDQPAKIAHPIAIAVVKRLNVQLVYYGVFVPKRID